ncbi:MAG TPA: hypothetical protein VJ969_03620, partial [Desulfopila sp.]|nr:hypothetical protein [Desulfopila sp.]
MSDPAGIKEVRCYFRYDESLPFVFMKMQSKSNTSFRGILPSPAEHIEEIEYLFLVINNERQVVLSESFKLDRVDGLQSSPGSSGNDTLGQLFLETEAAFSDIHTTFDASTEQISFTLAEKVNRFGGIAGLYTPRQLGAEVVEGYFGAFRSDP